MKPEQLEIAQLKREVIKLKAERDILKNHRGLGPPVGRETAGGYLCRGRERPSAFWWRVTPLKNMVHGLLRA
jgi:transposase